MFNFQAASLLFKCFLRAVLFLTPHKPGNFTFESQKVFSFFAFVVTGVLEEEQLIISPPFSSAGSTSLNFAGTILN